MRRKILVLAYQISPTRGSEYSVAWNYVLNMSRDNELVVLYGASGNHMGDISELQEHIKNNPLQNVRFLNVAPNKLANILNILNKNGFLVYSFYFAYNIWHRQVYKKAKELILIEDFDLIHFLGPNGYREPGYLWKLPLPYIWGPIGGTTNVSVNLMRALPLFGKFKLGFRAIANNLQLKFKTRVKSAIKRADILMAATSENQAIIKNKFKRDSIYIPENGIVKNLNTNISPKLSLDHFNLIWIGSIDERKALIILLKALIIIKNNQNFKLHIVGEGPLKRKMVNFAASNNINHKIVWHGAISREKVFDLLSNSNLNVITSVSEGNPTTIWEAMSSGIPTISLDHCGMHDTICNKCGVKIPIQSYNQVIEDLAFHLNRLISNPKEIEKLSAGVIECSKEFTWTTRHSFFNKIYDLAIENWAKRNSMH